jgi:molybdopterin synthase catalytic subunit
MACFSKIGQNQQGMGLQACHWAIDELKATVPIWKKECYEGGEVWKENKEFMECNALQT